MIPLRLPAVLLAASMCGACAIIDIGNINQNTLAKINLALQRKEQIEHSTQLRRMSRSLSLFSDLRQYETPDAPRMRTRWPDYLSEGARAFVDTLNAGDSLYAGYRRVTMPLAAWPNDEDDSFTEADRRAIDRSRGMVEFSDSVLRSAADLEGRVRGSAQRRWWREGLDSFMRIVSAGGSTTQTAGKVAVGSMLLVKQRETLGYIGQADLDLTILEGVMEREARIEGVQFMLGSMAPVTPMAIPFPDWKVN